MALFSAMGRRNWVWPATVALVVLTACGSSDVGNTTAPGIYLPGEKAALAALHSSCVEDDSTLDRYAGNAVDDLESNGIDDETKVTLLQHVKGSVPASLGKTKCLSIIAAYITIRETPAGS